MPFVTFDDSRHDHETCWLLDVRSLTNPPDSVILSPKTKGSVIPHPEWSWSEDSPNISQGRTNVNIQPTPVEWAVRKGKGASPATQGLTDHLLGLLTRVSACPICPINKCTFVWHNFSPEQFVFKLVMNFEKFVHKIFLNSYICSHVFSQCHQSSSAAFRGCLSKFYTDIDRSLHAVHYSILEN